MIEADRVLRPLQEAEPAIGKLDTYESPVVLLEALRSTWQAVERTLRVLLRSDTTVPDTVRMAAMSSSDMAFDAVLSELRRRDRVSIELAGRLHELGQAVRRAEGSGARPADADLAQDVVSLVRRQVHDAADRPMRASAHGAVVSEALGDDVHPVPAEKPAKRWRFDVQALQALVARVPRSRPWVLGMAAGATVLVLLLAMLLFNRGSDMEAGVEAFRQQRFGVAEQRFRAELSRNEDNVTARLYLARILRQQGRTQEVAELLKGAARTAPRDPAVRRELGHLFLDLQEPALAVEQFKIAVEHAPEEQLNWVGLIEALYRAGDPATEQWVTRAPPAVQAMVRGGNRR
jgi:tetratricopeptide (TPR) repeat protein